MKAQVQNLLTLAEQSPLADGVIRPAQIKRGEDRPRAIDAPKAKTEGLAQERFARTGRARGQVGGRIPDATHEEVSRGGSGHAALVRAFYDPEKLSAPRRNWTKKRSKRIGLPTAIRSSSRSADSIPPRISVRITARRTRFDTRFTARCGPACVSPRPRGRKPGRSARLL